MGSMSYLNKMVQFGLAILAVLILLSVTELCRSTTLPNHTNAAMSEALNDDINATDVRLFTRITTHECFSVPMFKPRLLPTQPTESLMMLVLERVDVRLMAIMALLLKAIICIVQMLTYFAQNNMLNTPCHYAFFATSILLSGAAFVILISMYLTWHDSPQIIQLALAYPSQWHCALAIIAILIIIIIIDFVFRDCSALRVVRMRRDYRVSRNRRNHRNDAETTDSLFGEPIVTTHGTVTLGPKPAFTVKRDLMPTMHVHSSFSLQDSSQTRHLPFAPSTFRTAHESRSVGMLPSHTSRFITNRNDSQTTLSAADDENMTYVR